jgi:predicted ATP-grasp superfamily ATP-dependent carboligase
MAETLVVAGLWARPLAESAQRAGWRVIALDLFGDVDTLRASARWLRIGDPAAFAIDPGLLRERLLSAAREPDVIGWVAGSGFEPIPQALGTSLPRLPLIGMHADAVRRVRDPSVFFATLDRLGLAHPDVALQAPARIEGWLVKDAHGSGGWHIHPAAADEGRDRGPIYWQRLQPGVPMSALFLADGTRARLVALNRLLIRPIGPLHFVYHGALGPIRDAGLTVQLEQALAQLVPAFGLRGLASLDFLAHEGRPWLLELNARPSATMVLHDRAWPGGLVRAHVRAVHGELPTQPAAHAPGWRGDLVVYADRACRADGALAAELAGAADCHDLPAAGTSFSAGEPVCSISAAAHDPQVLLTRLDRRAHDIRRRLTTLAEYAA